MDTGRFCRLSHSRGKRPTDTTTAGSHHRRGRTEVRWPISDRGRRALTICQYDGARMRDTTRPKPRLFAAYQEQRTGTSCRTCGLSLRTPGPPANLTVERWQYSRRGEHSWNALIMTVLVVVVVRALMIFVAPRRRHYLKTVQRPRQRHARCQHHSERLWVLA